MDARKLVWGALVAVAIAGCGGGENGVTVRVVGGPAPVTPLAGVSARLDLADGSSLEATSGADGIVHFDVPPSAAPWDLTLARSGYGATSFVGFSRSPAGDVRLDMRRVITSVPGTPVSGRVVGTIPPGARIQVDTYAFETVETAPDGSWSSRYFDGDQPLRMFAVVFDPVTGRPTDVGISADVPREGSPTIDIPLGAMARARTTTTVTITPPTGGVLAPTLTIVSAFSAVDLLPMSDGTWAATGGGRLDPDGENMTWTLDGFAGAPTTWAFATVDVGGAARANLGWHVFDGGAHTLSLGEVREAPGIAGSSFTDIEVLGDATGYDVLVAHLGEDGRSTTPAWRVFYEPTGTARHVPSLPTDVSPTELGLGLGTTTPCLAMLISMHAGFPAWSTQAFNASVPEYGHTLASSYANVMVTAP